MNSINSSLLKSDSWPLLFFETLFVSCSISFWWMLLPCSPTVALSELLMTKDGLDPATLLWISFDDWSTDTADWDPDATGRDTDLALLDKLMTAGWVAVVDEIGRTVVTFVMDGITVCAFATPRAISCNACACNAYQSNRQQMCNFAIAIPLLVEMQISYKRQNTWTSIIRTTTNNQS